MDEKIKPGKEKVKIECEANEQELYKKQESCCNRECWKLEIEKGDCSNIIDKEITINHITCEGRILKLSITVPDVCKNRSIAIAVFLEEEIEREDKCKPTHISKGFRVVESLGKCGEHGCENREFNDICFVIPGEICKPQNMIIHVFANYLDFDLHFNHRKPCRHLK